MKFAQEFRKSLQQEGFPQKWVNSAVPYGQLKKCLKKVTNELQELGLDKDTLSQLATTPKDPSTVAFHYHLDGKTTDSKHFRPRLTFFIHLKDGVAVDAKLTPTTRDFLKKIVSRTEDISGSLADELGNENSVPASYNLEKPLLSEEESSLIQKIEVPLVFDGEFFDILQTDVSNLDALQEEEQDKLGKEIVLLGRDINMATKPSKGRKARVDLETWREIFELYLDARVFFSTLESDHGARTSSQAVEQLRWFQTQVLSRKLVHSLKLDNSRQAYTRFLSMNALLVQILKFQEINNLAVTKILKKFDKRTSLSVSRAFPVTVRSNHLLAGSVAKDLCAQMSTELISVVPQLDDYLCPICFAVAYWPVRLECQHIFCSRCLVKMSRKGERFCPLCRADVIMRASLENFDSTRAAFLREYFPKEVKEKIRANERERNREIFGPDYSDSPCSVM
ncbi:SPX domain-containing protein [Annulohypoxylon maeteangense]|uniref:SPX domain-containing protein n=1 Tax=Annulohypoxylon maeteangense TaxID=1927788 RepID=UPI0020079EA5|nr:SPX domain-containing protein [Annulohypoxylon maeteangense]KAI0881006.1 SPX domain-containing protein [Annulohypoxylon maeteangense]